MACAATALSGSQPQSTQVWDWWPLRGQNTHHLGLPALLWAQGLYTMSLGAGPGSSA